MLLTFSQNFNMKTFAVVLNKRKHTVKIQLTAPWCPFDVVCLLGRSNGKVKLKESPQKISPGS